MDDPELFSVSTDPELGTKTGCFGACSMTVFGTIIMLGPVISGLVVILVEVKILCSVNVAVFILTYRGEGLTVPG